MALAISRQGSSRVSLGAKLTQGVRFQPSSPGLHLLIPAWHRAHSRCSECLRASQGTQSEVLREVRGWGRAHSRCLEQLRTHTRHTVVALEMLV